MTLGTSNYPLPPPRVAHHSVTSMSAKYQILQGWKKTHFIEVSHTALFLVTRKYSTNQVNEGATNSRID